MIDRSRIILGDLFGYILHGILRKIIPFYVFDIDNQMNTLLLFSARIKSETRPTPHSTVVAGSCSKYVEK